MFEVELFWPLTIFKQKTILILSEFLKDIMYTRVVPGAECHTDHRLVCCKLKLDLKPKPRKQEKEWPSEKYPRLAFYSQMRLRLTSRKYVNQGLKIQASPQIPPLKHFGKKLKTGIILTPGENPRIFHKKNKDWFDENNKKIQQLTMKKRFIHQTHWVQLTYPEKKTAFRFVYRDLQCKLQKNKNVLWSNLAERTQMRQQKSLL